VVTRIASGWNARFASAPDEKSDEIDGIALQYFGLREPNAILVDDEIVAFQKRAPLHRAQSRHQPA
jgi:hypothetical protein